MSEDDCYFSEEHSNLLPPETPASSSTTNDFTTAYENEQEQQQLEQEEYIYDYEYEQQHEYVIYEEEPIEEISYIIPRPTKRVIWKRPTKGGQNPQASRPKRKRKSVEPPPTLVYGPSSAAADEQQEPQPKKSHPEITDKSVAMFYLQDIKKRSESFKPKKPDVDGKDILERLEQAKNCDVRERQCTHPTCNRKFTSIEVLAYHVSYAHQHYGMKQKGGTQICLVCGATFLTGQGKLSHMTSAHKDLTNEHGRACLLQRPNTIVLD